MKSAGQTFDEWFRQKKTQREYLQKQILALRTYGGYLKKGYNIVQDGTNAIKDFTGGEFLQHKDYIYSLKEVNQELLKSGKVESVLRLHTEMDKQRTLISKEVSNSNEFSIAEKQHIKQFLNNLESTSDDQIQEILSVVTPGKIELTDDERIKRIDKIYRSSQNLYVDHKKNISAIKAIMANREIEAANNKRLRKMYGLEQK